MPALGGTLDLRRAVASICVECLTGTHLVCLSNPSPAILSDAVPFTCSSIFRHIAQRTPELPAFCAGCAPGRAPKTQSIAGMIPDPEYGLRSRRSSGYGELCRFSDPLRSEERRVGKGGTRVWW